MLSVRSRRLRAPNKTTLHSTGLSCQALLGRGFWARVAGGVGLHWWGGECGFAGGSSWIYSEKEKPWSGTTSVIG